MHAETVVVACLATNPKTLATGADRCAAASKSLVFMVITDSLSWGIIGFPILGNLSRLNIHARVNVNDKGYHKAYKRFLARLVRARREAGLTQVEVAKRLGKAHSFVSKCELGERG